ncbi:MAG: polyprenyl synthetase family protein [Thermodesulfobacteriota bacterium]|nr:polyprenyl synthetase family protein [Thermodesulfobacteriota bacterium]
MADAAKAPKKEQLMAAIAPEVAKIEQAMRSDLEVTTRGIDPLLTEVLEYGMFNGGKRLRPLLVVLAARLAGFAEEKKERIYKLAIAFEYLHCATLFHDDVIDRADMRRGKPSVNKSFGAIAAILGGDFLHSRSMFLIGSYGGTPALDIFCQATNAMVDGEFLQLRNTKNYNLSEQEYFLAVKGKTALLIAATCEIGALAGGATAPQQQALTEYGIGLGTAFQIVDDLLDYQGDTEQTGKAVGNDFKEGKMTLPLILALSSADFEDKKRLLYLLENEDARESGFAEAYGLIDKYDGFVLSRSRAESIVAEAVAGLEVFSVGDNGAILTVLHALAKYVLVRPK